MRLCASCREPGHTRRNCENPPLRPGYIFHGHWYSIDGNRRSKHDGLDEIIVRHVGRLPVSSKDLHKRVVDDYGEINERVFYRYLKKLRTRGTLVVEQRKTCGLQPQYFYTHPPRAKVGVSPNP
jgi:hypothetical protein